MFPLGFAINAAFSRHEKALESYATIKASAAALYFAHRDWARDQPDHAADDVWRITAQTLADVHALLAAPALKPELLDNVNAGFSQLSLCNERLRAAGISSSELARAHEYAHALIGHFERLRNIRRYRTPASLRSYAKIFLNLLPALFAPHFAHLASIYTPLVGYGVAVSTV